MMALALQGKPQAHDSTYQKKTVSKTSIELVFSSYRQDGDRSAVTGGIGTEELNVYAPGLNLVHEAKKHTVAFSIGGDFITSASTDRIDTVQSSASLHDLRTYTNISYSQRFGEKGIEIGAGTGFSIESDYTSIPVRLFLNYADPKRLRTYHVSVEAFFDDLRWGRLNHDYRRPVTLIYPVELRYKEWYDVHNRYSLNLKTGLSQVINKRLILAVYPELIFQHGLLATSFHRVYFTDGSLRVENLPKDRIRFPLSIRASYFAGSRTILKPNLGYYTDNFGIMGGFVELESIVKVNPRISLSGFFKLYAQSGSSYFQTYGNHVPAARYYTSDHDLSKFQSLKAGVSFRWAPFKIISKKSLFDEINIRYAYLYRTTELRAHIISASMRFSRKKGDSH